MHPVSCRNTHHNIKDLVNHGMVKNTKTWNISRTEHGFSMKQKILNLCLIWHILRSYRFVADVTLRGNILSDHFLSVSHLTP